MALPPAQRNVLSAEWASGSSPGSNQSDQSRAPRPPRIASATIEPHSPMLGLWRVPGLIVAFRIHAGKQHVKIAELRKIRNAHRVKLADQMVAFMLHYPRVKTFSDPVDRRAILIDAL